MALFDKKFCDICGQRIKLLGNRKLEDGNLCKECAKNLSPFFSERRRSTVADIKEHLAYREANKDAVAAFNATRTLGRWTKVILDEDKKKFIVSGSKRWKEENPDVLDFAQVTGCHVDIDERQSELKQRDKEGKEQSYNPPRYQYYYDLTMIIHVNHRWFNEIRFKLNNSSIMVEPPPARLFKTGGEEVARRSMEYREMETLGEEIREALLQVRQDVRDEVAAMNAPKVAVTCPHCGATTIPTNGLCEYCSGAVG